MLSRVIRFGSSLDGMILVAAVTVGIALRLNEAIAWLRFPNAEAGAVALALFKGRGFADPWYVGQGPTAHLMPITPLIAAAIWTVFGVSRFGLLVAMGWSVTVSLTTFAVASYCLRLAGAPCRTASVAFFLLCANPLYSFTEAVRWQAWDGGFATLLALTSLVVVLRDDGAGKNVRLVVWKAVLPAATFIVNPIAGVASGAIASLSSFGCRRRDGLIRPFALMLFCLLLVLAPWVVRNEVSMKHIILTRDNLGLELAAANHVGAVHPKDERAAFEARQRSIHPSNNLLVQKMMMRAGGEVYYNKELLRETSAWIDRNRFATLLIWTRHLREFFFPTAWMFELDHQENAEARSLVAHVIALFGLPGLGIGLIKRDRRFWMFAAYLAVVCLLTAPFQPTTRYCWVIYPLLSCLAVDFFMRLPIKAAGIVDKMYGGTTADGCLAASNGRIRDDQGAV